jgi:hypothetical protein
MIDINDKQYHHNLHRSFNDGIPRWQNVNKEFQFYTGKENVNILGGHRQTRKRPYIKIIVYDLKKRAISNEHRTKFKTNLKGELMIELIERNSSDQT